MSNNSKGESFTTTIHCELSNSELDSWLLLDDSELEQRLNQLPQQQRGPTIARLLERSQEQNVTSKGELATALGVSLPMLNRYIDAGMPSQKPYEVDACREWLSKRREERGAEASNPLRAELLQVDIEIGREALRAKRLKNLQNEGAVVSREEILGEFADLLSRCKAIAEAMPDDFSRELPEAQRVAGRIVAKNMIDRFLRTLAGWKPTKGNVGE